MYDNISIPFIYIERHPESISGSKIVEIPDPAC